MTQEARQRGEGSASSHPFGELCRKIALLISDDWLVLAQFQPLLGVLKARAHALVVVANSSGRLGEVEALGVRVVNFDFARGPGKPLRDAAAAWALARILEAEDPDVVHLVGARPL